MSSKIEAMVALAAGAGAIGLGCAVCAGARWGHQGHRRAAAELLTWTTFGWAALVVWNVLFRGGWVGYVLAAIELTAMAMSGYLARTNWEAARRRRRPPRWDGLGDYPT